MAWPCWPGGGRSSSRQQGGATLAIGGLRLSSRTPANPFFVAVAAAALAADWRWLGGFVERRGRVTAELLVVGVSLKRNTFRTDGELRYATSASTWHRC